jgi:hypothetical protein
VPNAIERLDGVFPGALSRQWVCHTAAAADMACVCEGGGPVSRLDQHYKVVEALKSSLWLQQVLVQWTESSRKDTVFRGLTGCLRCRSATATSHKHRTNPLQHICWREDSVRCTPVESTKGRTRCSTRTQYGWL